MFTVLLASSGDLRRTIEPFCHLEAGRSYLPPGVLQCGPFLPQREPEIRREFWKMYVVIFCDPVAYVHVYLYPVA